MADTGTRTDPSNVWGPNEYSGQAVEGSLSKKEYVPLAPGGNTVDQARIPKTLNVLDKNRTQANPLGQDGTTGY